MKILIEINFTKIFVKMISRKTIINMEVEKVNKQLIILRKINTHTFTTISKVLLLDLIPNYIEHNGVLNFLRRVNKQLMRLRKVNNQMSLHKVNKQILRIRTIKHKDMINIL